nr:MAG: hypothetical protein JST_1220 [Candidatus Parcubacteria bacterium]
MRKFYIDNRIDWLSTIFYIIGMPFRLIDWLIKKMFKYLKIIISDIFHGVYKKLIAIIVFVIVIFIMLYISNLTHVQELKSLPLIVK